MAYLCWPSPWSHGAPALAAWRAATLGAATIFGLRDRGLLAPGKRADLVLLDDLESVAVTDVLCGGRLVTPELFAGREHPTPVGYGSVRRAPVAAELFEIPGGPGPTPVPPAVVT